MKFEEQYRPAVAAFVADAIKRYPQEACGFITLGGNYVSCANVAADPVADFELAPEVVAELIVTRDVAAIVHSHPNGPDHPTAVDMRCQMESELEVPWGIVSVGPAHLLGLEGLRRTSIAPDLAGGNFEATDPKVIKALDEIIAAEPFFFGAQLERQPLVGRTFRHGVLDCYSIVLDWWFLERGVVLKDFPRDDAWWLSGGNMYLEGFPQAGFVKIDHEATGFVPERGDVLLYQLETEIVHKGKRIRIDFPHHAGLYDGKLGVLHHLPLHLSRHFPLTWKAKNITHWLRYAP